MFIWSFFLSFLKKLQKLCWRLQFCFQRNLIRLETVVHTGIFLAMQTFWFNIPSTKASKAWKFKLFILQKSADPNDDQLSFPILLGCGDTLTTPSGTITSPGHPTNYPHGANCTWYITVTPGNLIRLSFDSFNLEYHNNCDFDYLEVYDNGTVQTGTKIGRYT